MISYVQQGLGASTAQSALLSSRPASRRAILEAGQQGEGLSIKAPETDALNAGFGKNTISIPGIAIRTVGNGLTDARKMIPTLQELQAQQKERMAEVRQEQEKANAAKKAYAAETQTLGRAEKKGLYTGIGAGNETNQTQAMLGGTSASTGETKTGLQFGAQTENNTQSFAGLPRSQSTLLDIFA